jgi:hypothetical protein
MLEAYGWCACYAFLGEGVWGGSRETCTLGRSGGLGVNTRLGPWLDVIGAAGFCLQRITVSCYLRCVQLCCHKVGGAGVMGGGDSWPSLVWLLQPALIVSCNHLMLAPVQYFCGACSCQAAHIIKPAGMLSLQVPITKTFNILSLRPPPLPPCQGLSAADDFVQLTCPITVVVACPC